MEATGAAAAITTIVKHLVMTQKFPTKNRKLNEETFTIVL